MKTVQKGMLLLFLMANLSIYSQQLDWKSLDLKGKVKSIALINYTAGEKFGKITKLGILSGVKYQFNENGLVIQEMQYGKNGVPVRQITFQYDTLSNMIAQNIYDEKGTLLRKIVSEYNQFNNKTFESIYGQDGILLSRSIFEYEEGVIPQKILTYNKQGVQINKQAYKYNKKTGEKSIATTNPNSKLIEKVEKYDDQKNLISLYKFDVEGKIKSQLIYTYDDANNLVASKFINENKLLVKRLLQYNSLGFLIEVKAFYPEKGKTDLITYQYDFDTTSNWTKSVEYVNSIPVRISEREIIYY